MIGLALAALFLPPSHFLVSSSPLRAQLVRRFGDERYLACYSALTVVAFVWLVAAYLRAPALGLWTTTPWVAAFLLPVFLAGSVLTAAGISTPNPVVVRQGHLFDRRDVVRGILRVSRNAFFWGVGLISLAQVIMLGDIATLLAFGSLAFLGIAGSFVLDAKKARQYVAAWHPFAAATWNVPFLAIIRGCQHLSVREIGLRRIAAGLCLLLAMLVFDASVTGSTLFEHIRIAFR
jgi:uncharacterized membrane protein